MKLKNVHIKNINKKILLGTFTLVMSTVPLIGCANQSIVNIDQVVVSQQNTISISSITYSQFKSGIENGLIASSIDDKAMKHNTKYLQQLIDKASTNEIIKLPLGEFYFYPQKSDFTNENYIIKFSEKTKNITIEGAGNDKNFYNRTVLKPYGVTTSGIHMFYFNSYRESKFKSPIYLEGITFKNFTIDGINATGKIYNSEGKGFMINLYKNCHWSYVTVKNTWGTGFGMDCPINSSIDNCVAVNCGLGAYLYNPVDNAPGASGFGIGTGYSDNESIKITNCIAIENGKFGFFFENQSRFNTGFYKETKGNFEVRNSLSIGNLYNYGGLKAHDVVYRNNIGIITDNTILNVYFDDESERYKVDEFTTEIESNKILTYKK